MRLSTILVCAFTTVAFASPADPNDLADLERRREIQLQRRALSDVITNLLNGINLDDIAQVREIGNPGSSELLPTLTSRRGSCPISSAGFQAATGSRAS